MHINESHITPHAWAKEAWRDSRLDILIPVTIGVAAGQFLMALLGLRSYHSFFLLISLAAAGYATLRTLTFLSRLARDQRAGSPTIVTSREAQELFLPLLTSVVIYGIIAPNFTLGVIFALVSLPHAAALFYLTHRYTEVIPTPASERIAIRANITAVKTVSVRIYLAARRAFRRTPDFTSH